MREQMPMAALILPKEPAQRHNHQDHYSLANGMYHCARLHDIRILRSTIERRGRAIIEVRSIHSCRCSDAHKLPCGIDTGSKHSDYECMSLGKPNNPYLYLLFLDRKP